jgi:hypothetical protein
MKTTTFFICAFCALAACSNGTSSIPSGSASSSATATSGQADKEKRQRCIAEAGITGTYVLIATLTSDGMQQAVKAGNGVSEAQAAKANTCLAS